MVADIRKRCTEIGWEKSRQTFGQSADQGGTIGGWENKAVQTRTEARRDCLAVYGLTDEEEQ